MLEPSHNLDLVDVFLQQGDEPRVFLADLRQMAREELDDLGVGHLLVVVWVHTVKKGVDVLVELLGIRGIRCCHIVDPS
jgi:hypothetical protein